MQSDFVGQTAVVTGGGTGLGRSISLELAKRGATVVIASRKLDNLNDAKAQIEQAGGKAEAFQLDVREADRVEALMNHLVSKYGSIDILINNAAGNFVVRSEDLSPNGWNAVIGIVLNGTWYCTSSAGRQMIKQRRGTILNIVATYAWTGAPGVVHSAAAKAGVLAMTRTLAAEWGRYGIRVNALAPGAFITEAASRNLLFDSEAAKEKIRERIPAGRLTTPDEIAKLAAFLCSAEAAYINGDVMTADGGRWLSSGFLEMMDSGQARSAPGNP